MWFAVEMLSAVEMLHDCALCKSIIDIDIDMYVFARKMRKTTVDEFDRQTDRWTGKTDLLYDVFRACVAIRRA